MSPAQLINNLHLCSKRNGKVFRKLSFYKSQYLFNQLLLQVQHSLSLQLFMALSLISFINRKHVHNTPTIWKPFKMWCSQSGEMKIQALTITSTAIHTRVCLHFLVKAGENDRYCQQIKSAADITKSTDQSCDVASAPTSVYAGQHKLVTSRTATHRLMTSPICVKMVT